MLLFDKLVVWLETTDVVDVIEFLDSFLNTIDGLLCDLLNIYVLFNRKKESFRLNTADLIKMGVREGKEIRKIYMLDYTCTYLMLILINYSLNRKKREINTSFFY